MDGIMVTKILVLLHSLQIMLFQIQVVLDQYFLGTTMLRQMVLYQVQ